MRLDELKKNEEAIVKRVNADKVLRSRLAFFGLSKGVKVILREYSLAKQTVKIEINRALLALRIDEAKKIEVLSYEEQ